MLRNIFPRPIHFIVAAMADKARIERRPAPVIETDYESAKILCEAICDSLGCRLGDLSGPAVNTPYMMMFDGVKIVARRIPPQDLYREHFGVLADIWSDIDMDALS
jgi:hypothetical protein